MVLLISLAATCSLVQFPFAAPIYLELFVAVDAAGAGGDRVHRQDAARNVCAGIGAGALSGVWSGQSGSRYIYEITWIVGRMQTMQESASRRVEDRRSRVLRRLRCFLRQHSPNGLMFAGNDCPELYFLSGLKNVTRDDTGAPPEEILKAIQSDNLNLVVINDAPYFPGGKHSGPR